MKIIILGAGQVGSTLAENLAHDGNDVTVIDTNQEALNRLQAKLDIGVVNGSGSYPSILRQAGAADTDMLIAVTNNDEANIVACQVAYTLFNIGIKIARIRARELSTQSDLFRNDAAPIDFLISPEQRLTDYIEKLIDYPGALQVLEFAEGKIQLVAIKIHYGSNIAHKKIDEVYKLTSDFDVHVAAIYRSNSAIEINNESVIYPGDEIFFLSPSTHTKTIMHLLGQLDPPSKNIIIAGGGRIGFRLAKSMEESCKIKIIEKNSERAHYIADSLNTTTVLQGEATDAELLIDEDIENTDVFVAVTNDDEDNIMSCLQAKRLGARRVIALIARTTYVDLVHGSTIDIAISPKLATIGNILQYIRKGDIVNVHSLRHGASEAIEIIAHGTERNSEVIGRLVKNIKLPKGASIAAVVRNEECFISCADIALEPDDHIILFVADGKLILQVEELFQIKA